MANMPIKRPLSTTTVTKTKRDWPRLLAHCAYICAGLSLVLVLVQLNLYSWHFNRIYSADVESAVMLTNGQTYFGRMEKYGPNAVVLFDVYYLQVDDAQATTDTNTETVAVGAATSNIKLMKLADDFYKPNNYLILNRDQILYWQHLQSNSPILEAIEQYEAQATQ